MNHSVQQGQGMKKFFIGIAILIGILMFLYRALSLLVNKGLSLPYSVFVVSAVVLCGSGLIWYLRERPDDAPNGDDKS